ncbi:IS110 family transposase [Chamaesiphon polymorphus]|uniref:IS110 family transposase n=1 Tax=Chamaesiphon polymorphus TaxID=2107691 RepID=UPI001FE5D99C|nr:transposase [Chamaesiphon polymorphus]
MSQSEQKLDILGIDISKAKFDVALIKAGGDKVKNKVFANTPEGFEQLQQWLTSQSVTQLHGCMEATSTYGNALARFLFEIGYAVSIVCLVSLLTAGHPPSASRNPSRTKAFGRSQLSRTKTDRTDAKTIAQFCVALTPALWTPPPIEVEQLQALVHRLDNLKSMRQQESNRLETADSIVIAAITTHIEFLTQQIVATEALIGDHFDRHPHLKAQRDLITSIPGIAQATASAILAEIRDLSAFESADQLAAVLSVFLFGGNLRIKPPLLLV